MMWMLLACASTKGLNESQEDEIPLVIERPTLEPPTLTVSSPLRGEFIFYDSIAVSGFVEEGTSEIKQVQINGTEVNLNNDEFVASVEGASGINLLNFRVEAEDGERSVDSIGIYKGPFHDIEEEVSSGLRVQIGQDLLDDGDPDLDDLASIAESMLNDLDVENLLAGQTVVVSGFDIVPNSFSHDGIDLQIQCGETLYVTVDLAELYLGFTVDTLIDLDGEVTASSASLTMQLDFEVQDGVVTVIPVNTTTNFQSVNVDIEYIPGLAEDLLIDWAQENLEEALAEEAESILVDVASDYLNSFLIDAELFAGVSIRATVSELDVGDEGLRIIADGLFYGPIVKEFSPQVGSAKMSGEPPSWPLSTVKPFAVAVSGDLANQLMFSAWATGFFDNTVMNGALIQGLAGDSLPPPLGPVTQLTLNLALPPSLHPPTVDGMTADLAIGEWQMLFEREDGEEIDFRVNLRTGVYAYVDNGRIKLLPDNRPSEIELGVATLMAPDNLDPGDLSALGRLMIPSLLGSVSNYLPSIDLPPIPLDGLHDGLAGEELTITQAEISVTEQAWALIEADFD